MASDSASTGQAVSPRGRRNPLRHPVLKTPDELTMGERAADAMRNGMGSWGFVVGAVLFLAGWMAANRSSGFDPYPFILLNLVLSCVAALQGAILLIAAKREDQLSSQLAQHDYEVNLHALEMIARIEEMTTELHDLAKGSDGTTRSDG